MSAVELHAAAVNLRKGFRDPGGIQVCLRCANYMAQMAEQPLDFDPNWQGMVSCDSGEVYVPTGTPCALTFGVLPSYDRFSELFTASCPDGMFDFERDERLDTCSVTCSELWDELNCALGDWNGEDRSEAGRDAAGQWCSDVLSCLGVEWI